MITTDELYEIIKKQQEEINDLKCHIVKLKELSDSNDYWLREMIDALTETVDELMDNHCCCEKYKEHHEKYKIEKRNIREQEKFYNIFCINK